MLIDGYCIPNQDISFDYISGWPANIQIVNHDKAENFIVTTLSGTIIMNTDNTDEIQRLPAGLYIINGKKIYLDK